MKVHKRKAEPEATTPSKKVKKEEAAANGDEGDDDERNKRTLFVRNLPFSVTDEQVVLGFDSVFYVVFR